jgi:hypothetical protein
MADQIVYITLDWREEGPLDSVTGRRFWQKGRKVCAHNKYPKRLPCHNPNCQDGGFEIGDRIAALLASRIDNEQNSLICTNALHEDRAKRCLHTILYSLVCVYPYRRGAAKKNSFTLQLKEI